MPRIYLPDSLLALQRSILGGYYTSWLVLIAELPQATTALETSILAMTAAKIGRMNDDPVLVKASLRSYVQGLWELQKALWDPKLMYRDETLAACLRRAESAVPTGETGELGCESPSALRRAPVEAAAPGAVLVAGRIPGVVTPAADRRASTGVRPRRM